MFVQRTVQVGKKDTSRTDDHHSLWQLGSPTRIPCVIDSARTDRNVKLDEKLSNTHMRLAKVLRDIDAFEMECAEIGRDLDNIKHQLT